MDKLTIISGCLFLAADIFAIASIANPDWINTGEAEGKNNVIALHWLVKCPWFMLFVSYDFIWVTWAAKEVCQCNKFDTMLQVS